MSILEWIKSHFSDIAGLSIVESGKMVILQSSSLQTIYDVYHSIPGSVVHSTPSNNGAGLYYVRVYC